MNSFAYFLLTLNNLFQGVCSIYLQDLAGLAIQFFKKLARRKMAVCTPASTRSRCTNYTGKSMDLCVWFSFNHQVDFYVSNWLQSSTIYRCLLAYIRRRKDNRQGSALNDYVAIQRNKNWLKANEVEHEKIVRQARGRSCHTCARRVVWRMPLWQWAEYANFFHGIRIYVRPVACCKFWNGNGINIYGDGRGWVWFQSPCRSL